MTSLTDFPFEVIISHKSCHDGIMASYCYWRLLPEDYRQLLATQGGVYALNLDNTDNETEDTNHANSPAGALKLLRQGFSPVFVFVKPQEAIPLELVAGRKVLILDLDLGPGLASIIRVAEHTTLLDHHESSNQTIATHLRAPDFEKFSANVDTANSGCSLAWYHSTGAMKLPVFIEIVQIGDLHNFTSFRNTQLGAAYVLKALSVRKVFSSFPAIEETFNTWGANYRHYLKEGKYYLKYETMLVRKIARQADLGYLQTKDGRIYRVAYVEANVLHSDVGRAMRFYAEKRFGGRIDFMATWKYLSFRGVVSVSLRDPLPGLNLNEIARSVEGTEGEGGGHTDAASFYFYGVENFHHFLRRNS